MKFVYEIGKIIRLFLVSFACICSVACMLWAVFILMSVFDGGFFDSYKLPEIIDCLAVLLALMSLTISSFIVAKLY